jgi:hypothetical protein
MFMVVGRVATAAGHGLLMNRLVGLPIIMAVGRKSVAVVGSGFLVLNGRLVGALGVKVAIILAGHRSRLRLLLIGGIAGTRQ